MKHLLSSLLLCAVSFSMVGCVDMGPPGYGGGYGPPARPVYGSPPPAYYGGGGYEPRHDYGRPSSGRSDNRNYFGGPAEWYKSGLGLGRRDRKQHVSANYRRHSTQYDGRTQSEFARGYNDGYSGR